MTRGARKALWEFAASPSSRSRWPRGRSGAEAAAAAAEEEGGRAGGRAAGAGPPPADGRHLAAGGRAVSHWCGSAPP